MANFASAVMLGDLDDFIAPGQACVNPIFAGAAETAPGAGGPDGAPAAALPKIGLQIESDLADPVGALAAPPTTLPKPQQSAPDLIKRADNATAKVSLSDCLACSGCVTSAETVLIEQQSGAEFDKALAAGDHDRFVVTLSHQSCASLAAHLGCQSAPAARALVQQFLASKGVHHVLDTTLSGDVALLETAHDFVHRFRQRAAGVAPPAWTRPRESVAQSATSATLDPSGPAPQLDSHGGNVGPGACLPLLSSACPGIVCFCEKSHPESIPYLCSAKSPQQIGAALVKRFFAQRAGIAPARVYFATVMPCADKKLEASRKDFFDQETQTNDVDCVLTTIEIADMMTAWMAEGGNGADAAAARVAPPPAGDFDSALAKFASASWDGAALVGAADATSGGSGGYLDFCFRFAAAELFGVQVPAGPLPFKQGRNPDINTVELHVAGKPALKFATAYGFRNVQSIMRQMKRGKCPYDFVEIMACPGGCLNGGGQARPPRALQDESIPGLLQSEASAARERLELVKQFYSDRKLRSPLESAALSSVYEDIVGAAPYSDTARRVLHTRFHAVPKLQNALLEKW